MAANRFVTATARVEFGHFRTPWCTAFYESDCQGQFSSLLIAFRSSPLQSAPTDRNAAIVRTRG
ncbi:MAG: hypothetical protein M3P06_19465, partial [Acidobacteriota bacterium]|nr:hypothetical protein [Acidobacteriota bacterium]